MNKFEKSYVIDNSREADGPRERNYSIELSDREHLERLQPPKVSKEMEEAGFVYKPPIEEESMSLALKEKFEKARKLTKDTKAIKLGENNAKSKSKSIKSKTKKNNPKSNKPAMASVQKEL